MANHLPALTAALPSCRAALTALGLAGALGACSDSAPKSGSTVGLEAPTEMLSAEPSVTPTVNAAALAAKALALTQTMCDRTTGRFQQASEQLQQAVTHLTIAPGQDTLTAAQAQWVDTAEAWGSALPCLATPLTAAAERRHGVRLARTAAGPALAGFIDAIPGYPDSGLVHDETVTLSMDSLLQQHQVTDDGEVALGLFALEVLLFGVTERVPDDFVTLTASSGPGQAAAARRSTLTALVATDLQAQGLAWDRYWQQHRTSGQHNVIAQEPEALLHTHLTAWHAATQQLMQLAESHADGHPGWALYAAHDRALQRNLKTTLADWWLAPSVQSWVTELGPAQSAWQHVAAELAAPSVGETDWAATAQQAAAARQQLAAVLAALPSRQ